MAESKHIGSSLGSFLSEEGLLNGVTAAAAKRVLAWQLQQAMEEKELSKSELARQLDTSRAAVNRLLDPENVSVSLQTMDKAARALGKRLVIHLE
ncbi:MAG: helix-turn-helix domain-containing protein [Deltaproteobacteria bacterium]|jgi:DNA-binding Xre family transcriptional regulator|nr:helix-turn-helix domain-containing protein [Deltaproteobacteria bacterium]